MVWGQRPDDREDAPPNNELNLKDFKNFEVFILPPDTFPVLLPKLTPN